VTESERYRAQEYMIFEVGYVGKRREIKERKIRDFAKRNPVFFVRRYRLSIKQNTRIKK
jgi:hypothetical protein